MNYISFLLDVVLIGLLAAGIRYAMKLTSQLADMRKGRLEMERFIGQFNATVSRAEAGILGLKTTARTCGDDLERLIEKGQMLRDELNFLTESADVIANRLSQSATQISHVAAAPPPLASRPVQEKAPALPKSTKPLVHEMKSALASSNKVPSSAERELLRALEKLG
ncbi:MAG: DUF6468 domain-containing protein [Alphaproteobacteria bacterium]|nr:DUF6468 domain-containing protein [Alphaproteobacteria bacterium]